MVRIHVPHAQNCTPENFPEGFYVSDVEFHEFGRPLDPVVGYLSVGCVDVSMIVGIGVGVGMIVCEGFNASV